MNASRNASFRPNKLVAALALGVALQAGGTPSYAGDGLQDTATPIKHVVVIFQENVSFDHYFAAYPHAANKAGEPRFVARRGTPSVNGLTEDLLNDNPNLANPYRLDRSQALTCDMDHRYADEQNAADAGALAGAVGSALVAALVVGEAVARRGVDPALVEDVILGNANGAGEENRNVARMALVLAGLPVSVPGETVNRLCASGMSAVVAAARAVRLDEGEL